MKKITISLFILYSAIVYSQNMQLVWSDEFNYIGIPDNTKWSFETEGNNWDWGNAEAQNYTPLDNNNAWVDGNNLVIEARKEDYYWQGDGETKHYTSARLRTATKGDWLYGKIEVKALLPTGRGVWPAIWMLPTDWEYGNWPASGELDIMENVGYDPTTLHCNIHTQSYNHSIGTNKGNSISITNPNTNWHIYSIEWNAENVSFFCDGNLVFSFDNEHNTYAEWPFDKRFHLLLNVAVGGSWGGSQGIDDNIFPQKMLVDYVRVYQNQPLPQEPYNGNATPIPGTLEAEYYDVGGTDIAYSDASVTNEGGKFRNDAVDIEICSAGGYNISHTVAGEWIEYTVDISKQGNYDIDFYVASLNSLGKFHLENNNGAITNAISLSNSGSTGWQDWKIISIKDVELEAGEQIIRFVIDEGNFNIDKLIFTESAPENTLPYVFENKSQFTDSEIYVAVVGRQNGIDVWIDAATGNVHQMNVSQNTVQGPTYNGNTGPGANSMYADCFTTLENIPDKAIYFPQIEGCRILISFQSQLYLYFFGRTGGYSAPDLSNPTDPNTGIRYEMIELTWNNYGLWTNTTRVDSYQYPMGLEVWGGNNFYKKVGEIITHDQVLEKWKNTVSTDFINCIDNSLGIIHAPSKTTAFKSGGSSEMFFDTYINQIWQKYKNEDLIMFTGDAGTWSGRVQADGSFKFYNLTNTFGNRTAYISAAPNTQEVLEGKGVLAEDVQKLSSQTLDLVVQAQFCAAVNRHAINLNTPSGQTQDWSADSYYYTENPHNEYSAFWHNSDVSYEGVSYGFCYDDVFDHSSTIHSSDPKKVKITIGGFAPEKYTQFIKLQQGWNLVSLYVEPDNKSISSIFPNAIIVKNDNKYFNSIQADFLNSLSKLVAGDGYLIYNSTNEDINIKGTLSEIKHQLLYSGWNLYGYGKDVSQTFQINFGTEIQDIKLVKNLNLFYEQGNLNGNLKELSPSEAYFIKK